jgi:hypothetical protein
MDQLPSAAPRDRSAPAVGFTLCALCLGYAIYVAMGTYNHPAMVGLTLAGIFCVTALLLPPSQLSESISRKLLPLLLPFCVALEALLLWKFEDLFHPDPTISAAIILAGAVGVAMAIVRPGMRGGLVIALVMIFVIAGITRVRQLHIHIDVLLFQEQSSDALLHWNDPYAIRFPNIYEHNTPFYGPGVVDENNMLKYGFPYPPLSLLMVLPGYLLGNVRIMHVLCAAASGILMYFARPGRLSAMAAALFLLTPQGLLVTYTGWTEPLLTLNFSLAMFCACRRPKMLPWMLGLFFATKQYTVFALPALCMLTDGPDRGKQLFRIVWQAGLVVAVITLPFFFWNPREFIRAVALWQLVQPFRKDALSYLVWIWYRDGQRTPPIWIPLLAVIPAVLLALWKCRPGPSGFAAACTVIFLAFFAFNKQAFCNYYYFVIATACWTLGTMQLTGKKEPTARIAAVGVSTS